MELHKTIVVLLALLLVGVAMVPPRMSRFFDIGESPLSPVPFVTGAFGTLLRDTGSMGSGHSSPSA